MTGRAARGGGRGGRRGLGRDFGWLWGAYSVSAVGTWLAFDSFPLIAVLVLDVGPAQLAALAAVGPAVGALAAVPLAPWVEFRRKRPVMIAADLVRCAALLSVPAAYALGVLGLGQLLLVTVVVASADITFSAASGAFLKALLPREDLLAAGARFEATAWTSTMLGPPLGGFAMGVLGPVTTVTANAVSYLLSALGLRAIGGGAERAVAGGAARAVGGGAERAMVRGAGGEAATAGGHGGREGEGQAGRAGSGYEVGAGSGHEGHRGDRAAGRRERIGGGELLEGWRCLLSHPVLRPLFLNGVLVNGLIMAASPPLALLMLGPLGFSPWQYGLAFALPCAGGLLGSRLARRLPERYGRRRVLLAAGTLRACWSLGLVLVRPGASGLALVMAVQFALITCMGVYNPLLATARLELAPTDRTTRVLAAWSVSSKAAIAALTALWGLLAGLTGPRAALALSGALLLATPLLLAPVRRDPSALLPTAAPAAEAVRASE
ncbi:MFS transporter [Streptomyces sp. bgisy159]|uniref:MFS transporter n=1 Tax=Streptomyces sp. bgisy159 TaxID=3413795 RepID=UPI003F49EEFB